MWWGKGVLQHNGLCVGVLTRAVEEIGARDLHNIVYIRSCHNFQKKKSFPNALANFWDLPYIIKCIYMPHKRAAGLIG